MNSKRMNEGESAFFFADDDVEEELKLSSSYSDNSSDDFTENDYDFPLNTIFPRATREELCAFADQFGEDEPKYVEQVAVAIINHEDSLMYPQTTTIFLEHLSENFPQLLPASRIAELQSGVTL